MWVEAAAKTGRLEVNCDTEGQIFMHREFVAYVDTSLHLDRTAEVFTLLESSRFIK